jgi:hypothetical protein
VIYFFWDLAASALSALPSLFLVALSWLSIQLSDLITARSRNESVRAMLERLDDAVFVAVREAEQLLVIPLQTAGVSRALGMLARGAAKTTAAKVARACLGTKGWRDLGVTLGLSNDELERMLLARVEAAVYELRGQPASVVDNVLSVAFRNGRNDGPAAEVASAVSARCSKTRRGTRVQ